MKVAYVNNHYHLGGAETVVRQLHEGTLARGHQSTLYISDGKRWPRAKGLRPLYPRAFAYFDHSRFHRLVQKWVPRQQWTDRAFRHLGTGDADIIHVHAFHGLYASLSSLVSVARAKPLVWTFHRFWGITGGCDHPGNCQGYLQTCHNCPRLEEWPINGIDNTAESLQTKIDLLSPLPLVIVAPSQHLAKTVQNSRVGRNWRVEYIPNGVNLDRFASSSVSQQNLRSQLGLPPEDRVVLIVNREFTDPVKGFDYLRKALPKLSAHELAETTFVLVGGNAEWARQELSSIPKVRVAGFITDAQLMADYYLAADIFLYASPGENFPCSIIEAMAARSCVVSTPTDGVLEQITDGVSGLVATDFSPEALIDKLRSALSSSEIRKRLGHAAHQRAQSEFSEETMVSRHHKIYTELSTRHRTSEDQ